MTKTIASATDTTKKYFLTIEYGVATACTCKGFQYRRRCHHLINFNEQLLKTETFITLREQYDVRSETQHAARREAYCQEFCIY